MGLISFFDNGCLISKLMQKGENTHNILTYINTIPQACFHKSAQLLRSKGITGTILYPYLLFLSFP